MQSATIIRVIKKSVIHSLLNDGEEVESTTELRIHRARVAQSETGETTHLDASTAHGHGHER